MRLHTWVGYDVDGRGDIFWNNTFSKRLQVKIEQLKIYLSSILNLSKKAKNKLTEKKLLTLKKKLDLSIFLNEKILKSFSRIDFLENQEEFKKISNLMFKKKNDLITNSNLLIERIKEIVSTDLVGSRAASVVDSQATIAADNRLTLYVWYDNEFGYSCQVLRVVRDMAGLSFPTLPL